MGFRTSSETPATLTQRRLWLSSTEDLTPKSKMLLQPWHQEGPLTRTLLNGTKWHTRWTRTEPQTRPSSLPTNHQRPLSAGQPAFSQPVSPRRCQMPTLSQCQATLSPWTLTLHGERRSPQPYASIVDSQDTSVRTAQTILTYKTFLQTSCRSC